MQNDVLSDDQIVAQTKMLCSKAQHLLARIISNLMEVEERRIHFKSACSSMYELCTTLLGMSDDQACRNIAAARLAKRFPSLLGRVQRGEIHLSNLMLLREHLTDANHEKLLDDASNKSKRGLQEVLAKWFPRPDVPSQMRKLPSPAPTPLPAPTSPAADTSKPPPSAREGVLTQVATQPTTQPTTQPAITNAAPSSSNTTQRWSLTAASPKAKRSKVEPLSEQRHLVTLTISGEERLLLEAVTELMSHRNPGADIRVVVVRALEELKAKLEKEVLGKTARPQKPTARPAKREHVRRSTRREVFERDGHQCSFVNEKGRRCAARGLLQIDHRHPRALGGAGDTENTRVMCRSHNRYLAEQAFGKEHVSRRIRESQSRSTQSSTRSTAAQRDTTISNTPTQADAERAAKINRSTPTSTKAEQPKQSRKPERQQHELTARVLRCKAHVNLTALTGAGS